VQQNVYFNLAQILKNVSFFLETKFGSSNLPHQYINKNIGYKVMLFVNKPGQFFSKWTVYSRKNPKVNFLLMYYVLDWELVVNPSSLSEPSSGTWFLGSPCFSDNIYVIVHVAVYIPTIVS
jgi:hypothetical protein